MGLIKFEGKPIEKLIDVISQGIGTLYKPRSIRKEAEAEAYKIVIIEKAKANALAEGKLIDLELYENIQERIIHQETRKQLNIDNIAQIAANQLNQEEEVSNENVENDWTTRFFNIAEDISDEEMQNLWGRILAGEIKQPKSFSLRTLELLKNLSKEEAEIFTKFSNLKLVVGNTSMVFNQDNGKFLEDEFGIKFTDRLLLTELGLLSSENNLEFSFYATEQNNRMDVIEYGNKAIVLNRPENTPKQAIQVLVFTKAGIELSKLIEQETNVNYIKKICPNFVQQNVKIEYGDLVKLPNGQVLLLNKTEFNQ
ncbi:DUF2806 domain-containing protein [Flavobacterium sp. 7A]|uniref:DUF2806 domain-containing protein n=1 Tax=Flavobacterium sp. 7A TaxID=2940571 RepID=UPI0022271F0A|nr:DUF2806 domain-containing protein [Flavobacterium sp. 7A]MCW2119864.1 putative repeat protein (TIGR03899 family) [Flavobacterium sp. 7A]